jgi:hypothetical protein
LSTGTGASDLLTAEDSGIDAIVAGNVRVGKKATAEAAREEELV